MHNATPGLGISPTGSIGTTDYVFSLGPYDTICVIEPGSSTAISGANVAPAVGIPNAGKGMFGITWMTRVRDITDGTSNTMAMGEGTGGSPKWQLVNVSVTEAPDKTISSGLIGWMDPLCGLGAGPGLPNSPANIYSSSLFATTNVRMNNPFKSTGPILIQDTWLDTTLVTGLLNCGQSGTAVSITPGVGTHRVSNFRSDHTGGVNFVFADGSVHFISENIDVNTYSAISTIQGNEVSNNF
jgi:prepilin-type processing-associated H-X9-DG protein